MILFQESKIKLLFSYWHFSDEIFDKLSITSLEQNNKNLEPKIEENGIRHIYGTKESL